MVTGDDSMSNINFTIDSILPPPLSGFEMSRAWISILCCGLDEDEVVAAVPAQYKNQA